MHKATGLSLTESSLTDQAAFAECFFFITRKARVHNSKHSEGHFYIFTTLKGHIMVTGKAFFLHF